MDEPVVPGFFPGNPGRCLHVGAAENGNASIRRPLSEGTRANNADYDATDVHLPFIIIPQRTGSLLGGLKLNHYCHPVFCYRLGRAVAGKGQESG